MENIFETIASAINPKLTNLEVELITTNAQIKRLQPNDSYFNALSRSFHLGMVGGSGKNTYRLNKRREQSINKSIEVSKQLTALYTKRDNLEKQIEDIKTGKDIERQNNVITNRIKKAEYWKSIKAGSEVALYTGNVVTVKKKNRLSIETVNGCKYTASEIIGREAAKYL